MEAVTITQITPPELQTLIENTLDRVINSQRIFPSPSESFQLLTIQEAAELLHLSVPTIYGLVSKSEIPCMKKGKRLYFSKQELMDWVKSGRKRTIAETAIQADKYLAGRKKRG